MRPLILTTLFLTMFISSGCREEAPLPVQPTSDNKTPQLAVAQETTTTAEQHQTETQEQPGTTARKPPTPPVFEDFQGTPQFALFPWAGDFRPAESNVRLPNWKTSIDHLVQTTGIAEDQTTGGRSWVFGSIEDSAYVGYFAPLAVKPQTTYRASFSITAELAEGVSAGINILEFKTFLWIPAQYTEETFSQNFRGSHEGKRLTGTVKGVQTFSFITGPETSMIHMILFRDGTHDSNSVMFDDIKIEPVAKD